MKKRVFLTSSMVLLSVGNALCSSNSEMSDGTLDIVDEVEISSDTNIVVEAGRTLKFEYVRGENSVTISKYGAGRLEIATSSHTNLSVNIVEGTFASARPAAIPLTDEFRPTLRIDANRADTFTLAASRGTNFISKIVDADGNTERWLLSWGGTFNKPYVSDEKLNGLGLIDFGSYLDTKVPYLASGHGGNLALNKIDGKDGFPLKEYFYVWKDRDDVYEVSVPDGNAGFYGPAVLGNQAGYVLRGSSTPEKGFCLIADGSHSTYKNNLVLDWKKVPHTYCPSKGFHLLRNRADESKTQAAYWTMMGWNICRGGGFILAEIVAYSNTLSEANANRVAAQLQSKWLGMKLNTVTIQDAATLDVEAFKFNIKTLDLAGNANIEGATNLCFDTLSQTSRNVLATGTFEINGASQPLVPDLSFEAEANISVKGTSRIQTVLSGTGELVKSGDGELLLADPAVSNMTVSAGILNVSPLHVRSAEYHLDAARTDTIDWSLTDGKKLVSKWHDTDDASRAYVKCESWLAPRFDKSHVLRRPYITENAAGDLPMVDFGTYFSVHHRDGWGACLNGSPRPSGLVDMFVAWKDYPEVKNSILENPNNIMTGPCFFGMESVWTRGRGGNGNGFPVHYSDVYDSMIKPANTGLVLVDGVDVDGKKYIVEEGVHVLAQRIATSRPAGFSIQTIGGCDQARVFVDDSDDSMRGVFGGLMIGEVLMFKSHLTDRFRMRISGALCSKWRNAENEWAYASLNVASGAILNHPYADLVPETLELAGKLSAVSVRPKSLKIVGAAGEIDGELKLTEGGSIAVTGNPEEGFESLRAASVLASGKGNIKIMFPNPSAYIGEEYRIIESANVVENQDFQWRASALQGTGTRVSLKAKSDGIYLSFDGSGMTVIIK